MRSKKDIVLMETLNPNMGNSEREKGSYENCWGCSC